MLIAPKPGVRFVTVKVTVVECDSAPLIPLIVTVKVLSGVLAEVLTVSVELPGVPIVAAENEAVAALGKPLVLRLTSPEKPNTDPVFSVYVAAPPGATPLLTGEAEIVKSGVLGSTPYTLTALLLTPSAGNDPM
jgi:hypothetical protein